MSRIQAVTPAQATGHTAEVYSAIKKSLGSVPNLFQGIGVNSNVLQTFLGLGPSLKLLNGTEQETIALVVAQKNDCDYCLAAHTVLGGMHGLPKEETIRIRKGRSEDGKRQSLIRLVQEIVTEKGRVSDQSLGDFRSAGYTDAHIPEVLLSVVQNIYTNYFNHMNQTEVDFPAAEKI
jgi:AhpD family alkylhydroperoxidase